MGFHVGQLIECVNAEPWAFPFTVPDNTPAPESWADLGLGKIYTVLAYAPCDVSNLPTVWLEEVRRPISSEFWRELGYAAERFRPLNENHSKTIEAMLLSLPDEQTRKRVLTEEVL